MAKSEKLQRESDKNAASIKYKVLPGWMSFAAFSASFSSAALLLFLSFPISDQRICPPEIANTLFAGSRSTFVDQLCRLSYLFEKRISPLTEEEHERALRPYPFYRPYPNGWTQQRDQFAIYRELLEYRAAQDEQRYTVAWSGVLLFSAACFLLALRLRDKRLLINKDRMRFPSAMLLQLAGKLERKWQDLSAISLNDSGSGQQLEFYFNGGGRAAIDLQKLSRADLETLFNLLDIYAAQVKKSPELIVFRQELFSSNKELGFTQIWEDELQARFASTNFVALKKGTVLQNGRLKVAMPISSGGLSAVYLVERGNGMAVLKESVIPEGTSEQSRQKAKELFAREASMLISLEHPQIARVLDYFQENDRDYLLLEYIPGVTLREYVRRHGAQSEAKVASWAKSISSILAYLHGQDPPVIHRDLTPDNLMITPSGELVLIDFGAANQYLGNATGTIVGKQFYISPEQFRGKATPSSDIYALGGTLFFVLTGLDPEALSVARPSEHRTDVSNIMDEIIAKCTALAEKDRFSGAEEFSQAIDNLSGVKHQAERSSEKTGGVTISLEQEERIYG